MAEDRITCTCIKYCDDCVPLIKKSLSHSNIAVRCASLSSKGTIRHTCLDNVISFDLIHNGWKWDNKVKISNSDRLRILKKISKDESS
jgi:hypothetical protein